MSCESVAMPEALELRDIIDAVLSKLDGPSLARACCVCKLWQAAGQVDRLWQTAYESAAGDAFQRNTQSQLPALLEATGGWRGLYAWYRRIAFSPTRRIMVDEGSGGGAHMPVNVSDSGEVTVGGAARPGSRAGHLNDSSQQNFTWSPNGALVAHTLCYRSTAGILGSSIASAIIIVDVKNGRRLLVDLEVPYPPFFLQWSDCGTRLAMLSNWNHMQVALRIMEVPLAALASPQPLDIPPQPKVVLAALGRPLFISWSPDGSRIVHAISGQECSLLDIDWALEEGQGRVLVPGLKVQGGDLPDAYVQSLKAPFWLQDPEERQWLLLPETATEWPGVEAMHGQVVLLAPPLPEAQLEGTEAGAATDGTAADGGARGGGGTKLGAATSGAAKSPAAQRQLLRYQLGDFTSGVQTDLAFAASRDACAIAWLGGRQEVWAVLRDPSKSANDLLNCMRYEPYSPALRVWHMERRISFLPAAPDGDSIQRPPVAMQWSPNGRRLLLLVMSGIYGGPQGVQKVQWVVWDRLEDGLSAYTVCETHHAPQEFVQSQASFFDSYSQAGTVWAPTSDAFCYSALPQGEEDHMYSTFGVYVQPVPAPAVPGADGNGSCSHGSEGAMLRPPPPTRITSGRSASWSPC